MLTAWNDQVKANFWTFQEPGESWTKVYLTVAATGALEENSLVEEVYSRLFNYLKNNKIRVLQEKLYGLSSQMEEILAARYKALKSALNEDFPATFIEGAPCVGGKFAGAQIIGVIAEDKDVKIETVFSEEGPVGVIFENALFKEIFFSSISGRQKEAKQSLKDQAKHMFYRCRELLSEQNCDIRQLLRTWIYFPRILDWYGEFNKARTECFEEFGFITENDVYFPASTGIQGKRFPEEECFMDALAFMPKTSKNISVSPMSNTRQNEAGEYGSSFARGMAVTVGDSSALYTSGTASINNDGQTVYHNDSQGQVLETLMSVAALLETEKSGLRDIRQAVAYCKNEETYKAFKTIQRYFGLENIPFVPMRADVCRDELLFETESIAATKFF